MGRVMGCRRCAPSPRLPLTCEVPMSDGGRLELDDRGAVVEESNSPSTAVDLDVLDESIAVTAWDFGAGSWVRCHRRPLVAFLLVAGTGGICWTTHSAPPTSPQPIVAGASVAALGASQHSADPVGSRRATDQLHAAMTVFRDPSSGAIVMRYSPTRASPRLVVTDGRTMGARSPGGLEVPPGSVPGTSGRSTAVIVVGAVNARRDRGPAPMRDGPSVVGGP